MNFLHKKVFISSLYNNISMKKIFLIVYILLFYYYREYPIEEDIVINEIIPNSVGHLVVKGTNVNYTVMQGNDNKYYLSHDNYGKYSFAGSIFMDYRNNSIDLDKHTIIYGHSMLNKTMFGSLKDMLKNKWFNNKDNYIITFETMYEKHKFHIFSVYTTKNENYYLNLNINDTFINIIKRRSVYNFDIDISGKDTILTLSSCYKNNKRIVVHAKKIRD